MMRSAEIFGFVGLVFLGSFLSSTRAFMTGPKNTVYSTRLFAQENNSNSKGGGGGGGGGFFQAIGDAFAELDAFMDDASARRLGNGAAFYGKRKSNFYGESDKNRKADRSIADPMEDYQGPTSTGLFKWMQDENGQMRPVTRMKNKVIERNPNYWDRAYGNEEE